MYPLLPKLQYRIQLLAFIGLLFNLGCQQSDYRLKQIAWVEETPTLDSLGLVEYNPEDFPYQPTSKRSIQGLLLKYAGRNIYHQPNNEVDAVIFGGGLAVDADGAPQAYHPNDTGLDALVHAGETGNWWALATDNGLPSGTPIIQNENDPAPGYFVSMTSLSMPYIDASDPNKYVDASKIAYFVLPGTVRARAKMALGDIAMVYNSKNKQLSYAIFADTGPEGKLGEGSMALATQLGISDNPRVGGVSGGVVYLLFPNSGDGLPKTTEEIDKIGAAHFEKWGGMTSLTALLTPQPNTSPTM